MIEDEFAVLLMIEDMLLALGHELAGTVSRIAEALRLVEEGDADIALLDVNIAGAVRRSGRRGAGGARRSDRVLDRLLR